MEVRVLGPLEAVVGERALDIGGPKQRAVLALLALQPNAMVSTDALVEALWGDDVPPSAVGVVRTYVYRLRRQLSGGHVALRSRRPGYVLEIDPDQVDAHRFEELARRGRRELDAGRPDTARSLLDRALRLWRGDALADLADLPSLQPAATRLHEVRLTAVEDRIDAMLGLGHHAEVVGDLEALTREHPFRERLWRQLIVALYRSERQADALAAYQAVRATLVDRMGVDPGPELQALEREVLTQAEGLRWRPPEAAGSGDGGRAAPERRKRLAATLQMPSPGSSCRHQRFVGRANERAVLAQAFDAARTGTFSALLVTGPPGIGKSALAARFGRDAEAAGAAVLVGRADEGAGVPFQPLREVIHHWATHSDDDELRLLGGVDARHLGRVVPSLAERCHGRGPEMATAVGAADRQRLLEALARWVEVLAADRVALIVLEDLHWADPATALAVRYLLRHPPPVGAMLLATLRDTEMGPGHHLSGVLAATRGGPHVHCLDLVGLAVEDVIDLLRSETGEELSQAGQAFAVQLHDLTGGNPLFIHETLRHLAERGVIAPESDVWTGASEALAAFGVPSAVVALIGQRLRRLPAATAEVLRPASVLGQHIDLPVLSRVADMPAIAVVEALEPALAARLVVQDGGSRVDGFAFAHTLVRQAIADGVGPSERARLHWTAGMAIASLSAAHPEPPLAQIAQHLTAGVAAGDPHTAVVANVRAAQRALSSFAFEDACTWFTAATDLLDTSGVTDAELAYSAWLGLGHTAGVFDDVERQRTSYLRAAAIAQRQSWRRRLTRAAVGVAAHTTGDMGPVPRDEHWAVSLTDDALAGAGDAPTVDQCLLLATKSVLAVSRDQVDQALDLADAAIEVAEGLGHPTALASALMARCWTLLGGPSARELDETARRALSLPVVTEARILLGALVHPLLVVPTLQLGPWSAVEPVGDGATARPGSRQSPHAAAIQRTRDVAVALCRGRFEEAERLLAAVPTTSAWGIWQEATNLQTAIASFERGRCTGLEQAAGRLLSQEPEAIAPRAVAATLCAQAGDHGGAAHHLEKLRHHRRLDRLGWSAPLTFRHLAEVAARLDDPRLAGDVLAVLEAYSGQMLVSYIGTTVDAAADRAIGQLLLSLGRLDEAVERLVAADARERSVGADALATRTGYWQGRARLRRDAPGDREEALRLLHQTSSRARELGMVQLARDAEELLRR